MDRDYLMTFPGLNYEEISKVMLIAIEVSNNLASPTFESRLNDLSKLDENLKIRNAAIKALEKTYERVI